MALPVRMPFSSITVLCPFLPVSLSTSTKQEKEPNKGFHTSKTSLSFCTEHYHNLDSLEISSSCKVQSMMKAVEEDNLAYVLESV